MVSVSTLGCDYTCRTGLHSSMQGDAIHLIECRLQPARGLAVTMQSSLCNQLCPIVPQWKSMEPNSTEAVRILLSSMLVGGMRVRGKNDSKGTKCESTNPKEPVVEACKPKHQQTCDSYQMMATCVHSGKWCVRTTTSASSGVGTMGAEAALA